MSMFERYRSPRLPWLDLGEPPRLESFNASGDPEQLALDAYLDRVEGLLHDHLPGPRTPVSVALAVGMDPSKPLLDQRDLDNYLTPIARRIHQSGRRVASAQAWKAHMAGSTIAVDTATPAAGTGHERMWVAEVNVSYEKPAYKQAIRDTVIDAGELPDGPVAVEICFAVSPKRNWVPLWKPTIDALGPLLGHTPGTGEWNPRDGRITQLTLHCTLDDRRQWGVSVAISAQSLVLTPSLHDEPSTIRYALSYDGYADGDVGFLSTVASSVEAGWKATGALPNDTDDLRRTLFFLQRRHRASDDSMPFGTSPFVGAIVKELRTRSPSGLPNYPASL